MEIRLSILDINFQHVQERVDILLFDKGGVFAEGDSENGDDWSFLGLVGLITLVADEGVPEMGESLWFYYHEIFADRLRYDGFYDLFQSGLILGSGLAEQLY